MNRSAASPVFGLLAAFRQWRDDLLAKAWNPDHSVQRRVQGRVILLGAGPGAADLITLRGLKALQAADVIFYDRLCDPALLAHARPSATCVSVG